MISIKSRIVNNADSTLKVTFLEKTIIEEDLLYSEITTLKLEPNNTIVNFEDFIQNKIIQGQEFSNHYTTIKKTVKAPLIASYNLNKTVASYDVVTNFNYISEDYDNLQLGARETDLPSILDTKLKRIFC